MKNLKKVLALVLACVMVFGTVAVAGSIYPDVADDAIYAESVKTLSALGIIKGDENGNFNPDATVTRAEMAKILCTMLGTGEIAQANTIFSDVPSSHWASGYVNYAQQYGAIAGYGDGTFGPEDPVTYEQVIKLIMAALGYTPMAEENGGYPTGYLYVAADQDVTERAIGNGPEPAPRSTVSILACNAMNTPVMERVSYGTEAVWDIMDGGSYNGIYGVQSREFKTLLTSKHKTYKVAGRVTDSYKGNASLKEGFVDTVILDRMKIGVDKLLGATLYEGNINEGTDKYELNNMDAAGTDAAEYVGYESYLYFKVDLSGDVKLVCVSPKATRNKSLVIENVANIYDETKDSGIRSQDKPQYYGDLEDPTKFSLSYWNDRDNDTRITVVELDPDVAIYVNNTYVGGIIEEYEDETLVGYDIEGSIVPNSGKGSVTLVDTDNNGKYDLIKVTEIFTAIVDTITAKSNRINFKADGKTAGFATKIILDKDISTNLREYSITIDGAAADVADLKEFDVLSIITNDATDPIFANIAVTRNVIEGTVTAKKATGAADDYVLIGGEKYQVANVEGIAFDDIDLNDEGQFYLDVDGDIVYVNTRSVISGDYAYLYSTGSGSFAGETYVRMFTKDGADVTYSLADKVKINGVQAKSSNYVFTTEDLQIMFVDPDFEADDEFVVEDAAVQTLFDVEAAEDMYDDALTAGNLVKALVDGANVDERTAYAINDTYADEDGLDEVLAKFVTYKVNSDGKITELNIAADWAGKDQFGYIGSAENVEWKESLAKFKGTNGKSIPENAIIFFANAADSISDYAVKTVADLVDGAEYDPYYFTQTDNGPAVVLMLEASSAVDKASSFAIFAGFSNITHDGEAAYSIAYWKDGVKVEETLTALDSDLTFYGKAAAMADMQIGDAFLYSKTDKGLVDKIYVLFSTDAAPTIEDGALVADFDALIDISDVAADFQFVGADDNKDNELIFGIVGKTKSIADGVRLTIFGEDGVAENGVDINVPSSAKVVYYNAKMNNAKKLAEAVVTDIQASNVRKDSDTGDILYGDFEANDIDDLNYVLVRVYKDVVTEVIFVRYGSDF